MKESKSFKKNQKYFTIKSVDQEETQSQVFTKMFSPDIPWGWH